MSDKIEAEILDVFGEEVDAAVDTPLVVIEGPKGDPGTAGKDGHSPVVTATKSGKTTTISVDGAAIATVEDGADGAPGKDGSPGARGDTGAKGEPGDDYVLTDADKQAIAADVVAGGVEATLGDMPAGVPTVTDADNGKVLRVVGGAWAAAAIDNANGVSF